MDFVYGEAFQQRSPEAYERLLLDALRGDASLFTRSDEVEYAWRFITSMHEGWASLPPPTCARFCYSTVWCQYHESISISIDWLDFFACLGRI